jgi:hypothetical protein
VGSVRGAWPVGHRRTFRVAFLCALLALGMLLNAIAPVSAPIFHTPAARATHQAVTTSQAATPRAGVGEVAPESVSSVSDARFAIASLSVHCFLNPCDEVENVAAGQHIFPIQEGTPCTIIGSVVVVGHSERFVYCRLDQPNVFTETFDGAQFDCVGSWLGCHNVMVVDTTNGR